MSDRKRHKLLYVAMRYDYGDPRRGLSFEEKNFHDALRRYPGVEVRHFDFMALARKYGVPAMSQMLVEAVQREQPQLLFGCLFNESVDPSKEAVHFITHHTRTVTCLWMADDHWRFDNYSRHWAPHVRYIVTTDSRAVPKYEQWGYKHKLIKSQWACNTFLYHPYEVAQDKAAVFIGQPHSNRRAIIEWIRQRGVDLSVYGWGWPEYPRIPFHEMVRMFSRSKVTINLTKSSADDSQQIKGRNFEVPGCRAFLLSGLADNLAEYYEPEKEIGVYHTFEEMIDKAKFYLAHESERRRVAERGYQRTLHAHTWAHRFQEIFARIGLS